MVLFRFQQDDRFKVGFQFQAQQKLVTDVPVVPCAGPMIQTRPETGPELGTGQHSFQLSTSVKL